MHGMRALALAVALGAGGANAEEVTVRNDSLTDFSTAVVVTGFIAGGGAGSWLTSPCTGAVRAVQVFWRSQSGTTGQIIHNRIDILRGGVFPVPGVVAQTIGGPVLNDGVINEWRFIDENNVIPVNVPVTQDETFVVALFFDTAPPLVVGPSVVRDTDGIQPNRNTIYSNFGAGFEWRSAGPLGVTGDWVIRAVVDCPVTAPEADVAVGLSATPPAYTPGQPLALTLVVDNAGPSAAPNTTIVDIFPAALTGVSWTCTPAGGASCGAGTSGNGNITQVVSMPSGSQLTYAINATVSPAATGIITNTASAVVGVGITDPMPGNNSQTLDIAADTDRIFAHGFEAP